MNRDTIPGKIPEPIWRRGRRNEPVPKLWSKRGTLLPKRDFSRSRSRRSRSRRSRRCRGGTVC